MALLKLENDKKNAIVDKNSLEVISCSLEDLFLSNEKAILDSGIFGQITIPEYQRPYVWQEKQIDRLLNDIIEHQEIDIEKPMYYLGSMIIHKDGDKLNIIDGQQRLTTMLLFNSFYDNPIDSKISYESPLSVENIKKNHSYLKKLRDEDSDFFTAFITNKPDFTTINVTLVITNSEDLAYTFFETQNTGGVRLSGVDIIKSHHLRAIRPKKKIAEQATKWESFSSYKIKRTIELLIKIRYWNNNNWKTFPFWRDVKGLKETVIEEFSEKTIHQDIDISHYFYATKTEEDNIVPFLESEYRHIRQPLYDGNNFMDYVHEYAELYGILFEKNNHPHISDSFYDFRNSLLHGDDGTVFLKELFEISLITYVSRFGFVMLFEASLWIYRYLYSLRVSVKRNITEKGVVDFAKKSKLIDKILQSYTIKELLEWLIKFKYSFDPNYTDDWNSKGKHVICLKKYFGSFTSARDMSEKNKFDKLLVHLINLKIENDGK
ncbi:DUF262 domain-containing protein [Flavobacterium sp. GN10]|uniref:DUF262 domain-containing protein n=1 Tax=Flavobacterium tagetis TaxID=2801336 RepID=A0ABS1KBZ6_9FLAO|nr:DUF262 domain-containing protein [Flavobacterium tagetis]MBL0737013.1 DUF262 domain-containing protein [Flavobacterium tagetis]